MQSLKLLVLLLAAAVLIVFSLTFIGYISATQTILETDYYQNIINSTEISSEIHQSVEDMLPEIILEEIEQVQLGFFSLSPAAEKLLSEMTSRSVAQAFDSQWVKQELISALDQIIPWVRGHQRFLDHSIEIENEQIALVRQNLIDEFKELSDAELAMFHLDRSGISVFVPMIIDSIELPRSIALADVVENSPYTGIIESAVSDVRRAERLFSFVPYLVFALFLLIFFLLRRFFGGLRWYAACLGIPGALFLLALGAAKIGLLIPEASEIATQSAFLSVETVRYIGDYTLSSIVSTPLIFFASGVILYSIGLWGRIKHS
ncbi:MAG: hypothetical protein ACQEQU_01440 [Spirochaetota bacterium]